MITSPISASIVICTLNRRDDIQRCVATITQQSRVPEQLIIVDAGDLGTVVNRLRNVCSAASIEFIYCQDQPSTTRQRNRGAENVTADIIFFLDDDVELDQKYLERILFLYEADLEKKIGGATGVIDPALPLGSRFWRYFVRLFLLAETRRDIGARLKPSNFPIHSTGLTETRDCEIMASTAVSFRTDVFKKYLFDVNLSGYVMAEDVDLSYRVSRKYRLLTVPDAVFRHSKSPVSRNPTREHEKRRLLFTQYFFQKNLGHSHWHQLARYWSLFGLALRYIYLGVRSGDMQRFYGLCDGLRAAGKNRLLWHRHFVAGPLDH